MLRVFLVDDEIAAREAIRAAVPWDELELEPAGETGDGELALNMLRAARPDVLITDIHMPFMDGMELCRRVRRELPQARIVIVSACEDAGRIREAVALGVRAFLAKPVDAAALRAVLAAIAAELREERARREREAALREYLAASGRFHRERLLEELYGGADAEGVLRAARAMGMNLTARRYRVLLLRPESEAADERALFAVHSALEHLAAASDGTAFLRRDGREFSLLVLGDGAKHLHTRACELAEAAAREVERAAGVRLAAAFGADVERLADVPASLADARARFALPSEERITTPTHGGGAKEAALPELDLPPLEEELRLAAPGDVDAILARRAELLGAAEWDAAAGYLCVDALTAAARIARENRASLQEIAPEALRGRDGTAELLPLCAEALRRALELREAHSSGRYAGVIRKARAYIGERCADPSLTLRDVAAHVALSNNHFCTVFAREMGVTFSQYLTSLRIARAQNLLRDTNLRTSEIAYAVGYNDPHYFSNLFKKNVGLSPRDYRRKNPVNDSVE